MTRVLVLASDLGATAGASLAAAIACHPRGRYAPTLVSLATPTESTASSYLERLGVPVRTLPGRRLGPERFLAFRRLLREARPDVVHLVGHRAAELAWLVPRGVRLVTSHGVPRFRQCVRFDEFAVLPGEPGAADLARLGVPAGVRVIVVAGDHSTASGLREAVWAFDILRYAVPGWHLVVIGDDVGGGRVVRFARSLNPVLERVHFLPARRDFLAVLRSADCLWLTAPESGTTQLLEALTERKPAFTWRGDRSLAAELPTDWLCDPGQPVDLAARTLAWIDAGTPNLLTRSSWAQAAQAEAVASAAATVFC